MIEWLAASLQFKDGVGFRELRRWQTKLAFQRIQKFNEDFSVPVLVGLCAEEDPGEQLLPLAWLTHRVTFRFN